MTDSSLQASTGQRIRGAAMVEVAIGLGLFFFFMVFPIIEFGYYFYRIHTLQFNLDSAMAAAAAWPRDNGKLMTAAQAHAFYMNKSDVTHCKSGAFDVRRACYCISQFQTNSKNAGFELTFHEQSKGFVENVKKGVLKIDRVTFYSNSVKSTVNSGGSTVNNDSAQYGRGGFRMGGSNQMATVTVSVPYSPLLLRWVNFDVTIASSAYLQTTPSS